ncbi:MAG: HAD hydrolase-like protein [Puniceicoccales bacterium]|jgi:phosphoglycolate phosphatase|nr:HAD hydrolase-like protein [Puniceicoccales bacterium]
MRKKHIRDYQHVSWDWNGTLLDDAAFCTECLNEVITGQGKPPIDLHRYQEIYTFPASAVYTALGLPSDEVSYKKSSIAYMSAYEKNRSQCQLHKDALSVLESIHAARIPQSIFSAYPQESLEAVVAEYGVGKFFQTLHGNDNIYSNDKAHRARSHFEGLSVPFDEILYFGDTIHDAEIAQSLGIDCILIAKGHQARHRLEGQSAKVVDGYDEVLEML